MEPHTVLARQQWVDFFACRHPHKLLGQVNAGGHCLASPIDAWVAFNVERVPLAGS